MSQASNELKLVVKRLPHSKLKLIDYCDENFKNLGTGSGRVVYEINKKYAIKIAHCKSGVQQNVAELKIWKELDKENIIPNIYYHASTCLWLVVDNAKNYVFNPGLYLKQEFYSKFKVLKQDFGIKEIAEFGYVNGKFVCLDYGFDERAQEVFRREARK